MLAASRGCTGSMRMLISSKARPEIFGSKESSREAESEVARMSDGRAVDAWSKTCFFVLEGLITWTLKKGHFLNMGDCSDDVGEVPFLRVV